jgi:hypothetical protein
MEIAHLLNQTVYVAAAGSTPDADGQVSYSAPASRAARVEYGEGNERDKEGTTEQRPMKLLTVAQIGPRDRVWEPGTVPADKDTPGYRYPVGGGSQPAVDLDGVVSWYETELG